jgi:hypothetical protein
MPITRPQIARYVEETLAVAVTPEIWQPARRLPVFLREDYAFYEVEFLGKLWLLMADKTDERSAATIRKHTQQVEAKWPDRPIVYVCEQITSAHRRRLIEQKIPFVVPGNQMYLPMLGIDLREHFRQVRTEVTQLAPATQAALLLLLNGPKPQSYDTQALSARLDCSRMTGSRCLRELGATDLGVVRVEGRKGLLEFDGNRHELWQRAQPLFASPVKRRQRVNARVIDAPWLTAGLTALAHYSMLAAPPTRVVATTTKQWKQLQQKFDWKPAAAGDPDALDVELWSYEPKLLVSDHVVDRLSLYLSLKDDEDERVQGSLEGMMEGIQW